MNVVAFANQKGGVGKTTTVVNLGAALSASGKRVLLVDLDAQAHLSVALGIKFDTLERDISQVLEENIPMKDAIIVRDSASIGQMHICPSNVRLSGTEVGLGTAQNRNGRLANAIKESVSGYDYVLIDCPPNLGVLTLNALVAATHVNVVAQVEYFAFQGMVGLLNSIRYVISNLNQELKLSGVIATIHDKRKNLHKEVLTSFQHHLGSLLYNTCIRDTVSLAEAPSHGKTIIEYDPRSYGTLDYLALCDEFLSRHEKGHEEGLEK